MLGVQGIYLGSFGSKRNSPIKVKIAADVFGKDIWRIAYRYCHESLQKEKGFLRTLFLYVFCKLLVNYLQKSNFLPVNFTDSGPGPIIGPVALNGVVSQATSQSVQRVSFAQALKHTLSCSRVMSPSTRTLYLGTVGNGLGFDPFTETTFV